MKIFIKYLVFSLIILKTCQRTSTGSNHYHQPWNESPCSRIFNYRQFQGYDKMKGIYGEIKIENSPKKKPLCLEVVLGYSNLQIEDYQGTLTVLKPYYGEKNIALLFYELFYDSRYNVIPLLYGIKFNNRSRCSVEYKDPESTQIIMEHCLYFPGVELPKNLARQRSHPRELIEISSSYIIPPRQSTSPPGEPLGEQTTNSSYLEEMDPKFYYMRGSTEFNEKNVDTNCLTPWLAEGHCKSILDCPVMLALSNKSQLEEIHIEILQNSQCGVDGNYPMVCCALASPPDNTKGLGDCLTPWKTAGKCSKLLNCTQIFNLKEKTPTKEIYRSIARKSRCVSDDKILRFCCELGQDLSVDWINKYQSSVIDEIINPAMESLENHPNSELLNHDICGLTKNFQSSRKNETLPYEFPWMVLLREEFPAEPRDKGEEIHCGGSLIHSRFVLTAAHCVTSDTTSVKLKVRVGEHNWRKNCDFNCSIKHQEFDVKQIYIHPQYFEKPLENDIAIIEVKGEVDMEQLNVGTICLPLSYTARPKSYSNFIVTGWGATEKDLVSDELHKIVLSLVNRKICQNDFKNYTNITSSHICAVGNGWDICNHDSGGPFQSDIGTFTNQSRFVQYGIISFGFESCGKDKKPSVYTNVAYFAKWILDTIHQ